MNICYRKFMKPLLDRVAALLFLCILSPLLFLIAVAVKISSPGPFLYIAERTGYRGKPFRIWKFRTMVQDAEKKGGGTTSLNDPRIFPLGKILRRWKLDELPQLINVLKGEMSFVGPRPELPVYSEQYSEEELAIFNVLPGITDYSSVEFRSLDKVVGEGDADAVYMEKGFKRKNALRLRYARELSISTDAKILLAT